MMAAYRTHWVRCGLEPYAWAAQTYTGIIGNAEEKIIRSLIKSPVCPRSRITVITYRTV